jgi:PhnB protein
MLKTSDGECSGKAIFQGLGLALNAGSDAEAEKLFAAVGKGGTVQMPLAKTFFASKFGMVADRFGIVWMVIAEHAG